LKEKEKVEAVSTISMPKVSANIPNDFLTSNEEKAINSRTPYPAAHRGRERLNDIKERNRKSIMEAPSTGAFWKQVKRLSDPAPIPVSVSANDLKQVFESRLNPPKIMPQSFNTAEHTMNNLLAEMIPDSTEDITPEGFFSAPWTEANIESIKDHIITHSLDSGSGEDAILYAEILGIPNDDLLFLCNECIRKQDGPSIWFRTAIIGLLK
jgi:hypothetical protein